MSNIDDSQQANREASDKIQKKKNLWISNKRIIVVAIIIFTIIIIVGSVIATSMFLPKGDTQKNDINRNNIYKDDTFCQVDSDCVLAKRELNSCCPFTCISTLAVTRKVFGQQEVWYRENCDKNLSIVEMGCLVNYCPDSIRQKNVKSICYRHKCKAIGY